MLVFFFNDTATTEIYTLSLHDALPISGDDWTPTGFPVEFLALGGLGTGVPVRATLTDFGPLLLSKVLDLNDTRSEEHTSELQSRQYLVCRLLLEKKKYQVREYTAVCSV